MQNQAWTLRQAAFQCKKRQKYNLIFCNSIQIPSSDKHLCMILCCLPIQCIGTLFSFHTDQAAFQSFSVTKHLQIDPIYKQFAFRLRKCINNGNGSTRSLMCCTGWIWLGIKVFVVVTMFLWVRATFPRYRYDQIMRLGWKIFIPATLVWLLVVGFWMHSPWNIWH
mgnify:CR=1 FL=1